MLLSRRISFVSSVEPTPSKAETNYADYVGWHTPSPPCTGLSNVGNTCYMNSTLQGLLHTSALRNFPQCGCNKSFCVHWSLLKLLRGGQRCPIPYDFIRNLKLIGRQFRQGAQEDAHEFMKALIERMGDVSKVFTGALRSRVRCKVCGNESDTPEKFSNLSLEINYHDLDKVLADFCRKELLTGEDAYACESCKRKTDATKQYKISKPPPILLLHFKRFTRSGRKNGIPIQYPETISLDKLVTKSQSDVPQNYRLYAVVMHIGSSCHSGHYVTYARAPNRLWYEFDDSCVRAVGVKQVINAKSAYMVLYELDQAKPKILPSPSLSGVSLPQKREVPDVQSDRPAEQPAKQRRINFPSEESPTFQTFWQKPKVTLGHVKDEYDRELDRGYVPKNKREKEKVPRRHERFKKFQGGKFKGKRQRSHGRNQGKSRHKGGRSR